MDWILFLYLTPPSRHDLSNTKNFLMDNMTIDMDKKLYRIGFFLPNSP